MTSQRHPPNCFLDSHFLISEMGLLDLVTLSYGKVGVESKDAFPPVNIFEALMAKSSVCCAKLA